MAPPQVVAICGNPNCGKTTIFNAITGLGQKVGNYPGVTVEKVSGQFTGGQGMKFTIIDVPGSYSLAAFSPDEYIATSSLYGGVEGEQLPDVLVCVVDATNLERSLYLVFQVMQIGRPMVLALNMIDLAERNGMQIDSQRLSSMLGGIPVVPVVGNQGKGITELKNAISVAGTGEGRCLRTEYSPEVERLISELKESSDNGHRTRAEYLRIIFDVNGPAQKKFLSGTDREVAATMLENGRQNLNARFGNLSSAETAVLTKQADAASQSATKILEANPTTLTHRIDKLLLHPLLGPLVLGLVMVVVFQAIFDWAQPFMNFIDSGLAQLSALVEGVMNEGPLRSLITNGLIGGVGSVLMFIPQIAILFFFISLLEDSGYMVRAAFLVDRMFRWCGLSGKSFIPLLSSFACAIPGIMATRTIEHKKLRLITILAAPLMSCSARLPVYTIMIAAFIPSHTVIGFLNLQGLVLAAMYLIGIVVAALVAFVLNKFLLRNERGTFLMEMPSYKVPTARTTLLRVVNRVKSFVWRAGTVIMAITIIIWALCYFPRSVTVVEQYDKQIAVSQEQYDQQRASLSSEIDLLVEANPANLASLNSSISAEMARIEGEVELSEFVAKAGYADRNSVVLVSRLNDLRLLELRHERQSGLLDNQKAGSGLRNSYLGRMGRAVEPLFAPLGWDWKITMAVLASFPAREVIIATLGTIYNLGSDVDERSSTLVDKMRLARHESGARMGEPVFTGSVALSIMVFFALCCQCGATLVTIKQETGRWIYSVATFTYMSVLAYVGALTVYQIFSRLGF